VSAAFQKVPFGYLLRRPEAAVERLTEVRALRLLWRDADLALTWADQVERDSVVVDFTARLLAALVRTQPLDAVRQVLVEALPWVTFLPEPDVDQLLTELVTVAQGAASLGTLGPVEGLLNKWGQTAAAYSDAALPEESGRGPKGDFGPVSALTVER